MAQTFTRKELYDLVWSKPITHLARDFALSDVAIHKICKKHSIPKPPLGWWAKKQAGKSVKQTPLPRLAEEAQTKITIASAELGREGAGFAEVREQARIRAAEGPSAGEAAHPIVDRTIAKLRKAKPSDTGVVVGSGGSLIDCTVAPASVDRLETILSRLVHAVTLHGFTLAAGERSAVFKSAQETVSFTISETVRRSKHVLTAEEEVKLKAWQQKRERARLRNPWDHPWHTRPQFPEWDYTPTGQLCLEFETIYLLKGTAPRRSFRDAKIQRLENMASDIAVGLTVLAAAKTEARCQREARDREIEAARRERERLARAKHIDDRRRAGLDALLKELEDVERLRRLTDQLVREDVPTRTPRVSAFLFWLEEELAARDSRVSAQGLETRFQAERLFGDDDDHDFRHYGW